MFEAGVHCVNLLEYVTGDPIAEPQWTAPRFFPIAPWKKTPISSCVFAAAAAES